MQGIAAPLWAESTHDNWIHLTRTVMWKACRDVIIIDGIGLKPPRCDDYLKRFEWWSMYPITSHEALTR